MNRRPANKRSSARGFNKNQKKSHVYNFKIMRGGWRL